jgi:DNA-binding MarR family transcriptional regulator
MAKSQRVIHLLQQANSALFRSVDALLRAQEGIVTAHQVILLILRQDDGLTASKLAERAGMQPSRLTGLLDSLVERGLIRREPSLKDGRVNQICLTADGRAMAERTAMMPGQLNKELLAPFDSAQQATIVQFLLHVSQTAKSIAVEEKRKKPSE